MASIRSALLMSLAALATARDIPSNVQDFYNNIKAKGECSNKLASNFHSLDHDDGSFSYCGDHLADSNVVYLQGKGGNFVNMDIDCDGIQKGPADDGRCGSSSDTQSVTSFQGTVKGYGSGQQDLDAFIHPYVVFGNDGSKPNWPKFKPQSVGVEPLSLMAVVCNNKLIYGIWGDTNGDDGNEAMVGEASISVATACYGAANVNGNAGHDPNDVLYIAFTGADAVPGKDGAKWNARSYDEFAASISALGDKLIQRLGGNGNTPPASSSSSAAPSSTAASSTGTSKPTSTSTVQPTSTNTANPTSISTSQPTSTSSSFTTSVSTTTSEPTVAPTTTTTAVSTAPASSAPATTAPTSTGGEGCQPPPPASTSSVPPPASTGSIPGPPAYGNCSWKGHCEGATCRSGNDCSDNLVCKSGRCARS